MACFTQAICCLPNLVSLDIGGCRVVRGESYDGLQATQLLQLSRLRALGSLSITASFASPAAGLPLDLTRLQALTALDLLHTAQGVLRLARPLMRGLSHLRALGLGFAELSFDEQDAQVSWQHLEVRR